MRTYYIDCTNTLYTGLHSGIQRVVTNIIRRCSPVHDRTIECVPVVASYGEFYRFDGRIAEPLVVTRTLNNLLGGMRNIVDRSFGVDAGAEKAGGASIRLEGTGTGASWHTHAVLKSRSLVPFLLNTAFFVDRMLFNLKPVRFNKGDVLFLADVFWDTVLMDAIRKDPHDETIHILLLFDILPVIYPQFFRVDKTDAFYDHLPSLFQWADGIISISRSSLDEIMQYGSHAGYNAVYDYFHLGADFKDEAPEPGKVREKIKDIFDDHTAFLMVGTIEPRKNHRYVLETFDRLWENDRNARLCIVGKIGWRCKETMDAIFSSPHYGRRLFMINDATDAELNYCYSRAKAVIIASFAEGFGLPLVEALHYGKKVFASDIPVFREVGNDFPVYFSLDRPADLMDKIVSWKDDRSSAGVAPYKALSWDESIADLFAKITRMVESIDRQRHRSHDVQRTDA
jgi:glycosyltransferase involved in cell wall biosynthesis